MTDKLNLSITMTAEERKTRELFNTVEWSSINVIVAHVFRAMYVSALSAEQVAKIGNAMYLNYPVEEYQTALTALVKQRVLRSRMSNGGVQRRRLYEVNY